MPVNCASMLDRCEHLLEHGSEPAATTTIRSLLAAGERPTDQQICDSDCTQGP
jgi:hypothetical protein